MYVSMSIIEWPWWAALGAVIGLGIVLPMLLWLALDEIYARARRRAAAKVVAKTAPWDHFYPPPHDIGPKGSPPMPRPLAYGTRRVSGGVVSPTAEQNNVPRRRSTAEQEEYEKTMMANAALLVLIGQNNNEVGGHGDNTFNSGAGGNYGGGGASGSWSEPAAQQKDTPNGESSVSTDANEAATTGLTET